MNVAVSWSGGLESCLACHKAITKGYNVTRLVTFVLNSWPSTCHPLPLMHLQSKAIGISHLEVKVEAPYREGYSKAITQLKETEGIEGIVTGDIYVVDRTHGRWMESVCEGSDVDVIMPLWGQDTHQTLKEEVSEGFRAIFTCVRQPWFNEEWLGRELDESCLRDLETLINKHGIDPCGEKGEYHTMAIDGPVFQEAIEISEFSKKKQDALLFIQISEFSLKSKAP